MALVNWSEELSVGLNTIDVEHRKLLDILNSLHDAMLTGKGREVVGAVLDKLIRYTVSHFSHEEELMRKHGYADFEVHKGIHQVMTRNVLNFQKKHTAGTVNAIEVMNFLTDWLKKHIMETDKRYGPHLAAKGVA